MSDMVQGVLPLSDAPQGHVAIGLQGIRLGRCGHPLPPKRRLWCSDACCWKAWDEAHPRHEERDRVVGQRALPGASRVERAFREWIETPAGRYVEAEVLKLAREDMADGYRRGEINLYLALVRRASRGLTKDRQGYACNNSWRSLLARKVMAENVELAGYFETRDLRGVA